MFVEVRLSRKAAGRLADECSVHSGSGNLPIMSLCKRVLYVKFLVVYFELTSGIWSVDYSTQSTGEGRGLS